MQVFTSCTILPLLSILVSIDKIVANGDCISSDPEDDGGRFGYHSPGPNDTYLPDCQNPLRRELWRVFKQQDGSAYMIPRPDGLGIKYKLCSDENTSIGGDPPLAEPNLSEKAIQYGLCDEIVTDPSIINSMDPIDALQFANAFHRQLTFVANHNDGGGGGSFIDPYAPDNDILDACDLLSSRNGGGDNNAAESYCQDVANRCNDDGICLEMAILPSPEAVDVIVPALNEIYGVGAVGDECVPNEWGLTFLCPTAKCAEALPGCEYIFNHTVINDTFDCCPELCYAVDSDGNRCNIVTGTSSGTPPRSFLFCLLLIAFSLLCFVMV